MLSKEVIIDAVKSVLKNVKSGDQNRKDEIERAFLLCLDDLTNRLRSDAFLTQTTQNVSANDREVELTGERDDLHYLFAVKIGDERPLEFVEQAEFLANYDRSDTVAGTPTVFTIFSNDDGLPLARFNCPLLEGGVLKCYYLPKLTEANLTRARSVSAIVNGTVAYFYSGTLLGNGMFARYKETVGMMKSSDPFLAQPVKTVKPSQWTQDCRSIKNSLRSRRA